MKRLSAICLLFAVLIAPNIILATSYSYEELFTGVGYRDNNLTTADWGTNVSGVATPGLGPREITATTASSAAVPKGVAANGKYIFCAASDSSGSGGGLYVFDGETYGQVGSFATDDDEQAVALSGGYAYLVDDNGEITEVDVGNLSSMSSGTYSVGAGVNLVDAAYANGYLYVAAGTNGFYSVKVADGIASASHTNNSTYAGGSANARGVAIYGRYLLVADNNGLYVFSLSNPANPAATGNITSINNCYDIDLDGYFAFVASGDRINVVNLANPASPSLFTFSLTTGTCTSAAYNAGYVLGSCGTGGVEAYRFDYSTLKFSSTIALSGAGASAEGAVTLGKQTAVANGYGGGVAFVSNAHVFSPASEYDTLSLAYGSGETVDLVVNGKYAYATVQTYGLITIDLTTMAVVNIDAMSGASALGMALVGDRLLVAAGASGLYFFDITSPGNPSLDGAALSVGGGVVYDVVSDGKFAYLAMGGAYRGFARVDLFSRAYSGITTAYDVFDVELSGNWLSAACRDHGLAVFDIKEFDSGSPSVNYYTDFTSGSCWGSLIDNNYAYVALGDGGFSIVDISDPTTSLSTVGGLDYSTVGRIIGVGRYDSLVVLIRDATEPMLFVDVTNPASPTLESSSLLPEGSVLPEGIVQWNDYMLFADFFGGVKVWETYTQKNILPQSKLTSTKINGSVSGIKYFLWKSQEYFPEDPGSPGSTDGKDTVTFWTVFSDGTNKDSVKIFHSGVPDTTYYKYPEPLPWGADTAWEYIGYLANPVNDLRWKGNIQEAHEGWTVGGAWHACSLGIRFTTDDPPAARMRVSVRVHVNFGGGDVTELVIGLDSAATDRYDPGMDELYYPTGPGPHAYWAIDDPDMPEGAGLSTCWVSTRAAGRPIRLVLSDPAVLMWSIPPELDRGVLVLDGTDMAEATSISVSAGEYRALPGAGAEVYFRSKLSRGWNMVAPMAYPTVNSTADIFGVPVGNIWTYDDAYGGYYNSSAVGDGLGYFVLSTSDVSHSFYGVIARWVKIKLHPGWNIIGGPTEGPVHVSAFETDPDSLIWPGPLYALGDDGYVTTEWLEPGIGYWVYSMGSGVLYAESGASVDKALPLGTPDAATRITLASGDIATELTLGVDPRAGELSFDRLLLPPIPGKRNLGGLIADGAPTYLSTVVKPTAGEWDVVLFENCRVSSDRDLRFVRDGEEFAVNANGTELSAGRFKVHMVGAPLPKDFFIAASPNPFNAIARITAFVPREGDLDISIYDLSGRKVSTVANGDVAAGRHTYMWKAMDFDGRELPSGVYFARLSLDGGSAISRKLILLK